MDHLGLSSRQGHKGNRRHLRPVRIGRSPRSAESSRTRNRGPTAPPRGRKGKLTDQIKTQLRQFVADHPDATLAEIKEQLQLDVALSTVDRWVGKLDLSFKKSPSTPPSRSGPMLPRRVRNGNKT
jgi:transposase